MAITCTIAKPTKWFSNKPLNKLSFLHFPSLKSRKSPTPPPPLSPDLTVPRTTPKDEKFMQVFCFFDSDKDGKISTEELRAYFLSIGENLSYDKVQRVVKEFDLNGDNLLEYEEFAKLMERDDDHDQGGEEEEDVDLRKAFEMFEVEKGCGCITPKGLQRVLERLRGDEMTTNEECEAMIQVFDLDGNGVLDFHEFQKMMS